MPLLWQVGEKKGEARALLNVGAAYFGLGQYGQALGSLGQAFEVQRAIRDRRGEATTLDNIRAI